jgi:hypothetical protein
MQGSAGGVACSWKDHGKGNGNDQRFLLGNLARLAKITSYSGKLCSQKYSFGGSDSVKRRSQTMSL